MGRAEKRRAARTEQKNKTVTYNLTKEQIDRIVHEKISSELDRLKEETMNEAVNQAMLLMFTLPLEVLMDHYWIDTYTERLPGFVEKLLRYYEMWQSDELDMDKLKEDLWEYGGIRLEEER